MKINIEVEKCWDCPLLRESPQYWYCEEDQLEDLPEDRIIAMRGGPRQFIPSDSGFPEWCPRRKQGDKR